MTDSLPNINSSKWATDLMTYCNEFNIPIAFLAEIMQDAKVNPMIRGKGFEYSALDSLRKSLSNKIWQVTKPSMNASAMFHDVDILVKHLGSQVDISVECKLSGKGSFKQHRDGRVLASVKCMRSRTLGVELINQRAPQMGVSVPHLTAHKDSYLSSDFDIVISSLGNAFYETDEVTGSYVWKPKIEDREILQKILGPDISDQKRGAFEYFVVAKASDLAPKAGFKNCPRNACKKKSTCEFIPNYPVVEFDLSTGNPKAPWHKFNKIEQILNEFLSKK